MINMLFIFSKAHLPTLVSILYGTFCPKSFPCRILELRSHLPAPTLSPLSLEALIYSIIQSVSGKETAMYVNKRGLFFEATSSITSPLQLEPESWDSFLQAAHWLDPWLTNMENVCHNELSSVVILVFVLAHGI